MHLSVFDIFKVGIGPSSSHTVGPMKAARRFAVGLAGCEDVVGIQVQLFGSLGSTGRGHGSDRAVVLGLEGETPENVPLDDIPARMARVNESGQVTLPDGRAVRFRPSQDLVFHRRKTLPLHPNGMSFIAVDAQGATVAEKAYYSVGGGFVLNAKGQSEDHPLEDTAGAVAHPFTTGAQLLEVCVEQGWSVSTLMRVNETRWRPEGQIREELLALWRTMEACMRRGCEHEGILPGGLRVRRRAPAVYRRLRTDPRSDRDPLLVMDWVNLFALAVNEENAAGGRVVTAPTNGAAGIVPAVIEYYRRFVPNADDDGVVRFLLAAGAIGLLYKINASISGAEVGCQGEVGVACSMAAGGLTEVLGGSPAQVENAAEIGMEHNLGLTCDPIGGLVQVPCIERNAMGAVKAINAARLSLQGDGTHFVSLDKVIRTMRETGKDMSSKYKETARGGLAVNITEC